MSYSTDHSVLLPWSSVISRRRFSPKAAVQSAKAAALTYTRRGIASVKMLRAVPLIALGLGICARVVGGQSTTPPIGCFDLSDAGATYEGGVATTVNGYTCNDWGLDSPHSHGFNDNAGNSDFPANFCRNPDGEPGPWCYTTDVSLTRPDPLPALIGSDPPHPACIPAGQAVGGVRCRPMPWLRRRRWCRLPGRRRNDISGDWQPDLPEVDGADATQSWQYAGSKARQRAGRPQLLP